MILKKSLSFAKYTLGLKQRIEKNAYINRSLVIISHNNNISTESINYVFYKKENPGLSFDEIYIIEYFFNIIEYC